MKKSILGLLAVLAVYLGSTICFMPQAEAADVWVCDGYYIVTESVVYGNKTSYYAKLNVKRVARDGSLLNNSRMEINKDGGDWYFGSEGSRSSLRAYDYEYTTAIVNWLIAHRSEAHPIGNGMELVF
ncbi:hypothetical protein [Anaerovibrio lipolyticus]|uniref:hypothetical protein n=1 Tax=Anaerovibrio lipolyticus TaxID=82374 RepID=UPI0023F4BDF1|nr:hypothetical protein [Anaerovibrio lipolyticus]